MSDKMVCDQALNNAHNDWDNYLGSSRFKREALLRGLTAAGCISLLSDVNDLGKEVITSVSALLSEMPDFTKSIEDLKRQRDDLVGNDIQSLNLKIDELQSRLEDAMQSVSLESKASVLEISANVERLESQQENIEVKLKALSELTSKEMAKIHETFNSLEARQEQLDQDGSATKVELEGLKDALRINDQEIDVLSRSILELEQTVAGSIATKLSDLSTRFSELEQKIQILEDEQSSLRTEQVSLADRQAQLTTEVTELKGDLDGLYLPVSEDPDLWLLRASAIQIEQQQFCRIIDKFYDEISVVWNSKNAIKTNKLFKDRQQDLAALLPNGNYRSWIVRVLEVKQADDGSASVTLQPPCRVLLGSNPCDETQSVSANIPPTSLIYRELAELNAGDFVTISGKLMYAGEFSDDKSLPQFAKSNGSSACVQRNESEINELFVTELSQLARLQ